MKRSHDFLVVIGTRRVSHVPLTAAVARISEVL